MASAATLALALAVAVSAPAGAGPAAATARTAPSGLVYSTASAGTVQAQPRRGSCRMVGSGLDARPDARCTPGAANPAVTQSTIGNTICRSGWTATVRPPESVTGLEKLASMAAYGLRGPASAYEYDHDVPLELGGAVNDPRNLWPEPDYASSHGFYKNPKDKLENALKRRVCRGAMTLAAAQRAIASNWVSADARYG